MTRGVPQDYKQHISFLDGWFICGEISFGNLFCINDDIFDAYMISVHTVLSYIMYAISHGYLHIAFKKGASTALYKTKSL